MAFGFGRWYLDRLIRARGSTRVLKDLEDREVSLKAVWVMVVSSCALRGSLDSRASFTFLLFPSLFSSISCSICLMELLSYYAYLRKCYPISIFSREVRALSSHSEVSIPSASEPTSVLFLANTTSKTTQIEHKSLIPTSNKSAKATTMAPTKLECITCQDDTKTAEDFPSRPPTSECRHPIRSCKICLEAWITTEIDDAV